MNYWERARHWAGEHTDTYNLKKAVPSIIIAVIQYFVLPFSPVSRTLLSLATILIVWLLLYLLEFLFNLFVRAPVNLDAERQSIISDKDIEIADLRAQMSRRPYDDSQRAAAENRLMQVNVAAKDMLRFLLQFDRVEASRLEAAAGMSTTLYRETLNRTVAARLIEREEVPRPGRAGLDSYWFVQPAFVDVLRDLLFPRQEPEDQMHFLS
jgi:hypothetical protein